MFIGMKIWDKRVGFDTKSVGVQGCEWLEKIYCSDNRQLISINKAYLCKG